MVDANELKMEVIFILLFMPNEDRRKMSSLKIDLNAENFSTP